MVPFAGLSRKDIQNVKVDQLIYTDGRPYQIENITRRQTLVKIFNTAILFLSSRFNQVITQNLLTITNCKFF